MKLAVTVWQNRVAPVFDDAQWVALFEVGPGRVEPLGEIDLGSLSPGARIVRLVREGVDAVVCGAISRPLEIMLVSTGLRVISGVCGPAPAVLNSMAQGRGPGPTFRMPGCRGRFGRRFGGRGRGPGPGPFRNV